MSAAKKITVLLAEDHAVVRQGLRALLEADGRFQVTGEAQTGREAVQLAATLRPDVILMDIAMPVLNGLEATRQILAANPAARVAVLSAHNDEIYVERADEAGVAGFLEKRMSAEHLTKAVTEIAAGRTFYSAAIMRRRQGDPNKPRSRRGFTPVRLTSREAEVLQLVAEGEGNKQVAASLGISVKTVEKHRQHLMDKLNIHETAGLTRYAIAAGIIESSRTLPVS
jgi:DNA-binding NarL/FixJ family response regulator